MYFIVKVKFVEGNHSHPRHKIVGQADTLEESLATLESFATEYIIKKLKPSFAPVSTPSDNNTANKKKTITEVKFTMTRNKSDNNIIEIFENTCTTEVTPAMVFGVNEKTTRNTRLIGYFCYIKYDELAAIALVPRQTPSLRRLPAKNPELIHQMTSNDLFQKCQRSVAMNSLDACELSADADTDKTNYDGGIEWDVWE